MFLQTLHSFYAHLSPTSFLISQNNIIEIRYVNCSDFLWDLRYRLWYLSVTSLCKLVSCNRIPILLFVLLQGQDQQSTKEYQTSFSVPHLRLNQGSYRCACTSITHLHPLFRSFNRSQWCQGRRQLALWYHGHISLTVRVPLLEIRMHAPMSSPSFLIPCGLS